MPTNISDFAKFISFLNILQDLSDDDFDAVVDFAKTLRSAADKAGKKAPPSRDKVNSRGSDKRLRGVQMTVDDFLD